MLKIEKMYSITVDKIQNKTQHETSRGFVMSMRGQLISKEYQSMVLYATTKVENMSATQMI